MSTSTGAGGRSAGSLGLAGVVVILVLAAGCSSDRIASDAVSAATSTSAPRSTTVPPTSSTDPGTTTVEPPITTSTPASLATTPPPAPTTIVTIPPIVSSHHVGTGSVTVAFTQPFARSGSANATIGCTITRNTAEASMTGVRIGDVDLNLGIVTANYRGPGTYSSTVALAIVTPLAIALAPGTSIPVTMGPTGGTVPISGRTTNGRPIAGSISWRCPT